jgi:hypothetical protein
MTALTRTETSLTDAERDCILHMVKTGPFLNRIAVLEEIYRGNFSVPEIERRFLRKLANGRNGSLNWRARLASAVLDDFNTPSTLRPVLDFLETGEAIRAQAASVLARAHSRCRIYEGGRRIIRHSVRGAASASVNS